jgi:hypothetical protein
LPEVGAADIIALPIEIAFIHPETAPEPS